MSDAVDMFSQAERTPCTLLYMINGQTVDVGKATIINPTDRMIHTMQMPNTISRFPWRVSNRATRIWLLRYNSKERKTRHLSGLQTARAISSYGRRVFFVSSRPP